MRVTVAFAEMPPRLVRLSGDVYTADRFTATATGDDLPGTVTVHIRITGTGAAVVDRVTLAADRVRGEDLRAVPLGRIRDLAVQVASLSPIHDDAGEIVGGSGPAVNEAGEALRRRQHVLDGEHLRRVADVYRAAATAPTTAVAGEFGVPRATAARWVQRARQDGHLPPAKRGRDPRG